MLQVWCWSAVTAGSWCSYPSRHWHKFSRHQESPAVQHRGLCPVRCVCTCFYFEVNKHSKQMSWHLLATCVLFAAGLVWSGDQVPAATGPKRNGKVTVIRMTAPPNFLPAPMQKTTVVKVRTQVLIHITQTRSTQLDQMFVDFTRLSKNAEPDWNTSPSEDVVVLFRLLVLPPNQLWPRLWCLLRRLRLQSQKPKRSLQPPLHRWDVWLAACICTN